MFWQTVRPLVHLSRCGYNVGMYTRPTLPHIPRDANKYSRGSLLVLAGSRRYSGAGVLATLAAEKAGAGYVSLATPASAAPAARNHLICSPVIVALEDEEQGSFVATALPAILQEMRRVSAVCAGPGITVQENTKALIGELLQHAAQNNLPLLLDADALGILAADPALISERQQYGAQNELGATAQNPLVLSPHEGELARLHNAFILLPSENTGDTRPATALKVPVAEAAMALADKLDAVIVAKGPATFIAGEGKLIEYNEATPALAKAGTGDVLAGVVSSLLAQGMTALDAALLGVQIHSLAGVLAEQKQGRRSVTALDVIDALPAAVVSFEN